MTGSHSYRDRGGKIPGVGRVYVVLVKGGGVEQGIQGLDRPASNGGRVNLANEYQGAVGAGFEDGLNV